MEFNTYDIYTDASINLNNKIGCSGAIVVDRKRNVVVNEIYGVKYNATNNMTEIIAILLGIYQAIGLLHSEKTPFHVNIFSDSQISLFGMREWLTSWVRKRKDDTLINSSGVVANQEWFKEAYHAILSSNLKVKFFHQKGHVNVDNPKSLFEADRMFRTSNVNSLHMIGSTPQIISTYNNMVDNRTREIVNNVTFNVNPNTIPNTFVVQNSPAMRFELHDSEIDIYRSLISGGLNYPKYFNGGI